MSRQTGETLGERGERLLLEGHEHVNHFYSVLRSDPVYVELIGTQHNGTRENTREILSRMSDESLDAIACLAKFSILLVVTADFKRREL